MLHEVGELTAADYQNLARMKTLRELSLSPTDNPPASFLRSLNGLQKLHIFDLEEDPRSEVCRNIAQNKKLVSLQLTGDSYSLSSGQCMKALGKLPLRSLKLNLQSSKLISRLAAMSKLSSLSLHFSDSKSLARHFQALSHLVRLGSLELHGIQITASGLRHIMKLPLRSVTFVSAGLKDDSLRLLGSLSKLTSLHLRANPITSGLRYLHKLPLQKLLLQDCGLTDRSLRPIRALRKLTSLNLNDNSLTDRAIHVLVGLPLKDLSLSNTAVSDGGLVRLSRVKTLSYLFVRRTQVTAAGANRFQELNPNCWIWFYVPKANPRSPPRAP